ncbi:MAG: hypothetical protein AUG51_18340 [Acidobacteria bacterium 13_1_20CM_3_53_8]|nr:MAG: hypothetical protein AUG51_18340 [Acidobacteria bacterium 13_1_20CM_3_53_8]
MSAVVPASLLGLLNDAVGKGGRVLFSTRRAAPLFQIGTTLAPGLLDALSRPGVLFSFDDREHPDGAIKPGQPLNFRWGVHDWRLATAPGTVSDDPRYRFATASLSYNGNTVWSGTNRGPIIPADRLPRQFYRLRQFNDLRLEVRQSATATEFISTRNRMEVVADDPPTWEWTVPAPAYLWKRDTYTMSGRIRNNSRFSRMTVVPVMHEETVGTETPTIPAHTYSVPGGSTIPVGPSAAAPVAFPPINWDWTSWPWFDRITLVGIGNVGRTFRYVVNFTASDDYDNSYQALASSQTDVIVYVPLNKNAALLAAFTAQLTAAAALIAAGVSLLVPVVGLAGAAWWFGAASTAETIAQFLAGVAMDPPEPDSRYMEVVRFTQEPNAKPSAAAQLPSLTEFLAFAKRIADIPLALSQIEGKLMGARQANDSGGIELQEGSYVKGLQAMISDTESLLKLLPDVQKELSANPLDPQKIQEVAQSFRKGFTPEVREGLNSAGMPQEDQRKLEEAMKNPDVIKQATDLGGAIEKMAVALGQLTIQVRDSAASVLYLGVKPGSTTNQ